MQLNLKKILEFVFDADGITLPACQVCEDRLYAYIDAELDGRYIAAQFWDVRVHVETCQSCREAYQEMKALLLLERQGELVEPPVEADFDFSYLKPVTPPPTKQKEQPIWRVAFRAGKQVTELLPEVSIFLSKGIAFFEQLPSSLVPEWEVSPMPSRTTGQEQRVPVLSLPSLEHDLSPRLSVIPSDSEEYGITLGVKVSQISSGQPVDRCRVAIRDPKYRLLQSDLTHEEGRVSFANVQPGSYVLDVKYQGRVLQLPITLTWV